MGRRLGFIAASILVLLAAAGCGGTTESPRQAIQLPREATGAENSPAIQAALAVQGALNLPASQSTMRKYLGKRYAGAWIINNGRQGVLYVGVVHLKDIDRQFAKSRIRMGRRGAISLVNEQYSMTQLNAFDAIVTRYVERTGKRKVLEKHPFLGFGVSPPDNAVRFTLPKKDATFWTTPILRLVPYTAFVVQYSSATARALRGQFEG